MNSTSEGLTTTLKQAGLRLTPQRIAICRLLGESHTHPTADSIYLEVHTQYPSLSRMTVYNTLRALVDLGAVNALGSAGDDAIHYDGNTDPHINVACISCHRIEDVPARQVVDLNALVARETGFKLLGARVLYYGFCPACQKSTH
jgi:Fur family peroxide stress response transcriptional regulator